MTSANYRKIPKNNGFVWLNEEHLYISSGQSRNKAIKYLRCYKRTCKGKAKIENSNLEVTVTILFKNFTSKYCFRYRIVA